MLDSNFLNLSSNGGLSYDFWESVPLSPLPPPPLPTVLRDLPKAGPLPGFPEFELLPDIAAIPDTFAPSIFPAPFKAECLTQVYNEISGRQKGEVDLAKYGLSRELLDIYLGYAKGLQNLERSSKDIFNFFPTTETHEKTRECLRKSRKETKFRHTITATYDDKVIVHIKNNGKKGNALRGAGAFKKVYEAIIFDGDRILIAADLTIRNSVHTALMEDKVAGLLCQKKCKQTSEPGIYVTRYKAKCKEHEGRDHVSMIMPLYDGNLDQYPKTGDNFTKKITIMEQAARGIAEMHQNGCVHRDLKLENILYSDFQEYGGGILVKVADFGLSSTESDVKCGAAGNPAHQPPEVRTNPNSIDAAAKQGAQADVWGLGIMLLNFFFETNTESKNALYALNICSDQNDLDAKLDSFLAMLGPSTADVNLLPVINIVRNCLAFDPSKRMTAEEVSNSLLQILTEDVLRQLTLPPPNDTSTEGYELPDEHSFVEFLHNFHPDSLDRETEAVPVTDDAVSFETAASSTRRPTSRRKAKRGHPKQPATKCDLKRFRAR